jgi:hypothetical protein
MIASSKFRRLFYFAAASLNIKKMKPTCSYTLPVATSTLLYRRCLTMSEEVHKRLYYPHVLGRQARSIIAKSCGSETYCMSAKISEGSTCSFDKVHSQSDPLFENEHFRQNSVLLLHPPPHDSGRLLGSEKEIRNFKGAHRRLRLRSRCQCRSWW